MHIQDISDLNPHSVGFANRAAESINIIGNVLEDLLNGFGGAISDITGSSHGSHLNINRRVSFAEANPKDRINRGHLNPAPIESDAVRVQHDIDKDVPPI